MDAKTHWETIYRSRVVTEVSWYQGRPQTSLDYVGRCGLGPQDPILDVGGGASTLADHLLDAGYRALTVLDVSGQALQAAQARLGERAGLVHWLEADITQVELPAQAFALWHDRAVFHFLQRAEDRGRYLAQLRRALRPGGRVIMAAFAPDGPTRCSGLDVVRYSAAGLQAELGPEFELADCTTETHRTPAGAEQQFTFGLWRRR